MSSREITSHSKSLKVLYNLGDDAQREPSDILKVSLIALSVLFTFFTGGIVFGLSALHDILLVQEGAYSTLCTEGEALPCAEQEKQFTFMATCATAAVSICCLPTGIFLDAFGPRVSVCAASFLVACSLAALACATTFGDYLYLLGFVGLAIGGPAIFTSMNNFSDLFTKGSSGIIAAQSGAFQTSAIVMVAGAFTATHSQFGFSQVCCFYLVRGDVLLAPIPGQCDSCHSSKQRIRGLPGEWFCSSETDEKGQYRAETVPIFIFLTSLFMFPDNAYGTDEGPGHHGEPHKLWLIRRILLATQEESRKPHGKGKEYLTKQNLLDGKASLFEPLLADAPQAHTEVPVIPELATENMLRTPVELYNVDIWKQVASVPFLVIVAYFAFFILTVNFSVATIYDQLTVEAASQPRQSKELARALNSWFNILTPLGGLVGIPFAGAMLMKLGLPSTIVSQGLVSLSYLLSTIPNFVPLPWKPVGYLAFGVNRPIALGIFTSYFAEIFGFKNHGKLFGLAQLASSVVVPLQFLVIWLVHTVLQGNYFAINVWLALVQILLVSFIPYYLTEFVFSGFFFRVNMPV